MAEKSTNHINYGHPGAPNYELGTRDWAFGRQNERRDLKQVRTWKDGLPTATCIIPPSRLFPCPNGSTQMTTTLEGIKELAYQDTNLGLACEGLGEFAITSAAVSSAASTYDPLIGNLLDVGTVALDDSRGARLVAMAHGETGNVLRLVLLNTERHGWGQQKDVWVEGPSLTSAESGYTNALAAPIQQVCFSRSEDRTSLLAVRFPDRTVIYRPEYRQKRQQAPRSPYFRLPPSRLSADYSVCVTAEQTAGVSHADVTFNPHFQLQFAVVNQCSNWSIWEIEGGRKARTRSVTCLVQGTLTYLRDEKNVDLEGNDEDGWAKVLWVGNATTLAICNRKRLDIVSLVGSSYSLLSCSQPIDKRSSDWILDCKLHPTAKNLFYVLTSTYIMLMAVIVGNDSDDSLGDASKTIILKQIRHYRGSEDLTLSMDVETLDDNETDVLLYSRLNNLTQIYRFVMHPSGAVELISTSPASQLNLQIDSNQPMLRTWLFPLHYQLGNDQTSIASTYMQHGVQFFNILTLRADLSVHQALLCNNAMYLSRQNHDDSEIQGVSWSLVKHFRIGYKKKIALDDHEETIIPDGLEMVIEPELKQENRKPHWVNEEHGPRFSDFNGIYNYTSQGGDGSTDSSTVDLTTIIRQLEQISTSNSGPSPISSITLYEFVGMDINVPDVDMSASLLQSLVTRKPHQTGTEFAHIASAAALHINAGVEHNLSAMYDSMLRCWIASLPLNAPNRTRPRKEQLARRIAAEAVLSSIRICQDSALANSPHEQAGTVKSLVIFPSSSPPDGTHISQVQHAEPPSSSQTLPILPSSSIPSSSLSLMTSDPGVGHSTSVDDPLSRLSKHLRIQQSPPVPVDISTNIKQLLAHWTPGTDPGTYDWSTAEKTFDPEYVDEATQELLDKARRRKERKERKQKRKNELMRAQSVTKPVVFPRSSPGPALGGFESSQVSSQVPTHSQGAAFGKFGGMALAMPQSQIEPGKFGGRPVVKKKKGKGRISGF